MIVTGHCGAVRVIAPKFLLAAALSASFSGACLAGAVTLNGAQVPATATAGGDVPLTMTIINTAPDGDALLRVRCPFANFFERHTVDYGEGAPSMRAVPAIPLPANGTLVLTTKSYHVMLLQVREPLSEGQGLSCSIVFRNAGSQEVAVRVAPAVNP